MAKIMNGNRVVTNEVRLSYANVFTPKSINGGDEKYSVSLIIPKSDTETIALINKAIDQAITDGVSKFGGKKPNKAALKLPLRDGIEKDDEAYEDAYFMTEKSGSNLLLTMPETLKQKWILWRRWQGSRFQISFGNNMHRISASTI